ncbi:hypothetical protein EBU58_09920 [bacterium]|nr:hypothetical protein [bacterium]
MVAASLAWGILVESALLDAQLADDMRRSGCGEMLIGEAGPFFGPFPSPQARMAFGRYVQTRWPLHVFALDPVVQEQNIEDSYARRREVQIAMAMAFASGRMSASALSRYTRRRPRQSPARTWHPRMHGDPRDAIVCLRSHLRCADQLVLTGPSSLHRALTRGCGHLFADDRLTPHRHRPRLAAGLQPAHHRASSAAATCRTA